MRHFELLDVRAVPPRRATPGSAGYDLYALESISAPVGVPTLVRTGVTARMPEDEVLLIHLRSSLSYKYGLMLANGVGVIDADYAPNEIGVLILNTGVSTYQFSASDRIAQGIFQKYLTVTNDTPVDSTRTGGFGSTGK